MAQVKVYGIKESLNKHRGKLSQVIHDCIVEALQFPKDKRAHRFFAMDKYDMLYPADRSDAYTIIEIMMMTGRNESTRKKLIRLLFDRIEEQVGIEQQDIEICIYESVSCNWGFRGFHGDEVKLNYSITI
ncbi:tautomerase family protein [Aurantivibrio infirmus]